jgi:hypothetical protein
VNQFGIARTKCKAITLNAIAPMCNEELHIELNKCNSACITIDASTRNDIIIIPVIVCYFLRQAGIKFKEKTSEISSDQLLLLSKNMKTKM